MVFSSTTFLFLFLPIVIVLYYFPIIKSRNYKNMLLLIASLGFYAWGEPLFVFLMLLSILVTWLFGFAIVNTRSKIILSISIMYHVCILFVFKYLTFICEEISRISANEVSVNIELPIGISFFTFQLMSYLFDVYYERAKVQDNFLDLALYVSFFPQLIAGPIVRYSHIANQIRNRKETTEMFADGVRRFAYGLAKKVLISDYVAIIADASFNNINNQSVLMAWLGAIAYTLQIYFDFSGYSDMAIGLGRMFGFTFKENFNYPYISKSVTEFWRRWHISLSSWFKDYVYIPLGGNRVSRGRWIFNLFIVWTLTGVWHGANWTFLVWGLSYFLFLLIEKTTKLNVRIGYFSYIYTAVIVICNWVIFRADNLNDAIHYIGNMLGSNANGIIGVDFISYGQDSIVVFIFALIGVTPLLNKIFVKLESKNIFWIESFWVALIFVLSLIHAVASTYSPFIYFNF